MMNSSCRNILASLPRVRVDLRDIYRLDKSADYSLDLVDDVAFSTKRAKLFFIPSADPVVNNNIHRTLVLSDAVVVMAPESHAVDPSFIDEIRRAGKAGCVIVVFLGDYLIQPKGKHTDFPHTTPAPAAVFLLGQLTAVLGARQVVVLYEDGPYFKCPTDYYAASYIPLDLEGKWKEALTEHLRMLGIRVNKNISIDTFFGTMRI